MMKLRRKDVEGLLLSESHRIIEVAIDKIPNFSKRTFAKQVDIEFSKTNKSTRSYCKFKRKGKQYIKYCPYRYIGYTLTDQHIFPEYSQIRNRDDIGEVKGTVEKCCAALVAHEMAHAIQGNIYHKWNWDKKSKWNGFTRQEIFKSHGEGWRYIYKILRKYGVNQMS